MGGKSHISSETIIEALVFASSEPIGEQKLSKVAGVAREEVKQIIQQLNEKYERAGNCFRIRHVGGGYLFYVREDFAPWIEELVGRDRGIHLTKPMFETLGIIAVMQPISKPMIDKIRAVNSSAPLAHLMKHGLITIVGRGKGPGRPFLYGTTKKFLKTFGLNSAEEIPSFEELKRMFESAEIQTEKEREENLLI